LAKGDRGVAGSTVRITGQAQFLKNIRTHKIKGQTHVRVQVGYTAPYAIYVHENVHAVHPHGGQSKFLEAAYRRNLKILLDVIAMKLRAKRGLVAAMAAAGKLLLHESKKLCPKDTGYLQSTGYYRTMSA
jgi:hypothetical protein